MRFKRLFPKLVFYTVLTFGTLACDLSSPDGGLDVAPVADTVGGQLYVSKEYTRRTLSRNNAFDTWKCTCYRTVDVCADADCTSCRPEFTKEEVCSKLDVGRGRSQAIEQCAAFCRQGPDCRPSPSCDAFR